MQRHIAAQVAGVAELFDAVSAADILAEVQQLIQRRVGYGPVTVPCAVADLDGNGPVVVRRVAARPGPSGFVHTKYHISVIPDAVVCAGIPGKRQKGCRAGFRGRNRCHVMDGDSINIRRSGAAVGGQQHDVSQFAVAHISSPSRFLVCNGKYQDIRSCFDSAITGYIKVDITATLRAEADIVAGAVKLGGCLH